MWSECLHLRKGCFGHTDDTPQWRWKLARTHKEGKVGQLRSTGAATHLAGKDMTASTGAISGMHTVRTKKAHVHRYDGALRDCTSSVCPFYQSPCVQPYIGEGGRSGSCLGTRGSVKNFQSSWYGTEDYCNTTVHGHRDCLLFPPPVCCSECLPWKSISFAVTSVCQTKKISVPCSIIFFFL